jgi:hypothetical protein
METELGEKEVSPKGATWTMTVAAAAIRLALTISIVPATAPQTHRRAAKSPIKFTSIFSPVLLRFVLTYVKIVHRLLS